MNIIQPGDHLVVVIPAAFTSRDTMDHVNRMVADLPAAISKGSPIPFTVTWSPIGGLDSSPYVLLVLRDTPELPEVRTYVGQETLG